MQCLPHQLSVRRWRPECDRILQFIVYVLHLWIEWVDLNNLQHSFQPWSPMNSWFLFLNKEKHCHWAVLDAVNIHVNGDLPHHNWNCPKLKKYTIPYIQRWHQWLWWWLLSEVKGLQDGQTFPPSPHMRRPLWVGSCSRFVRVFTWGWPTRCPALAPLAPVAHVLRSAQPLQCQRRAADLQLAKFLKRVAKFLFLFKITSGSRFPNNLGIDLQTDFSDGMKSSKWQTKKRW